MKTSFSQWCKDAGPLGPALWLFDNGVNGLAHATRDMSDEEFNLAFLFGVVVFFASIVGIVALLNYLGK